MVVFFCVAHDTDGILHEADQRIEFATNCEVQLTNFTVAQNTLLRNDLNIESSKLVCASGKYNMEACFVSTLVIVTKLISFELGSNELPYFCRAPETPAPH